MKHFQIKTNIPISVKETFNKTIITTKIERREIILSFTLEDLIYGGNIIINVPSLETHVLEKWEVQYEGSESEGEVKLYYGDEVYGTLHIRADLKEKRYLLIGTQDDGHKEPKPIILSNGIASSVDEILKMWVDPKLKLGWVPDHMGNIQDDMPEDATEEEIREEAIRQTKARFGIGQERDESYSDEYLLIEVDLETGQISN